MELNWYIFKWGELNAQDLYDLLALRSAVFVVEQNCPYQDLDGKDQKSDHIFARDKDGELIACARIVYPGISYSEWSIGRVATAMKVRGSGTGKLLMEQCMNYLIQECDAGGIRISAQEYLLKFYEGFGFEQVSESYLEDDIPHVEMLFVNSK
jgi:ElaA protein